MNAAFFLGAFSLFLMALVRYSTFFITVPVFSETSLPVQPKVGISLFCALITLPHLVATQAPPDFTIPEYGIAIAREMFLGYSIGYVFFVVMAIFRLAGHLCGMQIGLSFVQVADPTSSQSLGVISEFLQMTATLLFLVVGGHLLVLQAFFESFRMVPFNTLRVSQSFIQEMVIYTKMVFICGFQISMPIIAVMLIGNVGLGVIARTVPKLNVFQMGFALKILLGLLVMVIMLPRMGDAAKYFLQLAFEEINTMFNILVS